jgi:nucleoside-diphosphate-sugar epimerase
MHIIGNGMLAKAFKGAAITSRELVLFASGVSNSLEEDKIEYDRELDLVNDHLKSNYSFVYFSSCSLEDSSLSGTKYVLHKKKIENIIISRGDYFIFRLPQVVGFTKNTNTLANFLYNKIRSDLPFDIWQYSTRNLIDVDDVVKITSFMIDNNIGHNTISNVAATSSTSILTIVNCFEQILNKEARYKIVQKGCPYDIENQRTDAIAKKIGVQFTADYLYNMLSKYYSGN